MLKICVSDVQGGTNFLHCGHRRARPGAKQGYARPLFFQDCTPTVNAEAPRVWRVSDPGVWSDQVRCPSRRTVGAQVCVSYHRRRRESATC